MVDHLPDGRVHGLKCRTGCIHPALDATQSSGETCIPDLLVLSAVVRIQHPLIQRDPGHAQQRLRLLLKMGRHPLGGGKFHEPPDRLSCLRNRNPHPSADIETAGQPLPVAVDGRKELSHAVPNTSRPSTGWSSEALAPRPAGDGALAEGRLGRSAGRCCGCLADAAHMRLLNLPPSERRLVVHEFRLRHVGDSPLIS